MEYKVCIDLRATLARCTCPDCVIVKRSYTFRLSRAFRLFCLWSLEGGKLRGDELRTKCQGHNLFLHNDWTRGFQSLSSGTNNPSSSWSGCRNSSGSLEITKQDTRTQLQLSRDSSSPPSKAERSYLSSQADSSNRKSHSSSCNC